MSTPRVLSIQSHVVHGYVGNKCAVMPLNRLGFDVDAINSVQFSNHTGYPTFKGSAVDGEGLTALVDGLDANGLLNYTHLLTGYIGSLSLLEAISGIMERLQRINPDIIYGELSAGCVRESTTCTMVVLPSLGITFCCLDPVILFSLCSV